MAIFVRDSNTYQQVSRPFVRVNGVYTGVMNAYVRVAGVYQPTYIYDVTPPQPPEISTQLIETYNTLDVLTGRYIKVGVRLPGVSNDPSARLVRVLTNYPGSTETPPTTQYGGTYTQTADTTYPGEPWSEWRFNDYGPHNDTSVFTYKQWPPNATTTTDIANDKHYFFTGWALDNRGNWSAPVQTVIYVPKASVDAPNVIHKEARFQANSSGSWTSAGFQSGQLVQANNPRSRGLWFYGSQLSESIGLQGTPTITSAQIYIKREDDTGQAVADIHLFWTPYSTVASLPDPGGTLVSNDMVKIGSLAKGQGDWFKLPNSFIADLKNNIKGMGLNYKDYLKATASPADYSVVQKIADNLRCGEIHVTWYESP